MTALFLNHQQQRCGVYQMGRRIGGALADAGVVTYLETWDLGTALAVIESQRPEVVIYNWHPSTLPWAPEVVRRFRQIKHVGLVHEIAPDTITAGSEIFRYRMVCDPTFPANDKTIFKSVRHVPRHEIQRSRSDVMTVGSFGFAVGGKMYATIVHAVGAEFHGARVRLRIPNAYYGDDAGALSARAAAAAKAVTIGNVSVEIFHDFLDDDRLIQWLSGNDLNVFFYEPNGGRGISSVLDYAIAARRPIAINDSQMFRHVRDRLGCYPTRSLAESLHAAHLVEDLYQAWSPSRLVQDYQHMLSVLESPQ